MRMVGTIGGFAPGWMKPPCDWPGCRDAADTVGPVPGRAVANVCQRHVLAGRKLQQHRGKARVKT